MNRYWLFAGETHYACGGFSDLLDTFEKKDSAIAFGKHLVNCGWEIVVRPTRETPETERFEWFHVIDSETGKVIHHYYGGYGCRIAAETLASDGGGDEKGV